MKRSPNPPPPNIMIVDDTPANLRLLDGMLREQGCHVRSFPRGRLALAAAAKEPPDLILLDINMPEMTGYEVCEKLKANEKLASIPVVFLTALSDTSDKVRAFACGGVDYITKPFQFEEVNARIETQLRLRNLQRDLSQQNRELIQICDQLREMETLRDSLVHMVVHDLRSPLTAMITSLEFLRVSATPKLNPTESGCASHAFEGAQRLSELIDTMLDVSRLEAGKLPLERQSVDLVDLARTAAGTLQTLLSERHFEVSSIDDPLPVCCDPSIVRRILTNLLDNAIRHTAPDGKVHIMITHEGGRARVALSDDGPGIPAEFHETIFDKFGQVGKQQKQTTGLGLTFCKLAVEAHGGRIGISSRPGEGSTFWFTLPENAA